MKTYGILISALAVAAGIVVGRLEYEREKSARAAEGEPGPIGDASAAAGRRAAKSTEPVAAAGRRPRPRGYTPSPDEIVGDVKQSKSSAPAPKTPDSPAAEPAAPQEPSSHQERLEKIEGLIQEQDFEKAAGEAEELVAMAGRLPPAAQARALRLKAKARVFGSLVKHAPGPASGDGNGDRMDEVLLANRSKFLATKVEKELEHFVIHLPNGVVYRPPLEEVLEVRPVARSAYLESQWHELETRVSKLQNPIDLYILGVQECYQRGLKKEGLMLLERLLADPESDQIPLLFAADAGESVLDEWRIAAGRVPAEELVARAARSAASSAGARKPPAAGSTADAGNAAVAINPETLASVSRLLEEAQSLLRNAATKEGREAELVEARKRLDRASQLLVPLPADEDVKRLRRQLSQLLSDVVRVSPF